MAAGLALAFQGCSRVAEVGANPTRQVRVFETEPLLIDRIFTSMTGPHDRVKIDYSGMDCVTSVRTEVVDVVSGEPMSEEFFCHSQLQLSNEYRPVVMATGISEVRLPQGFGLPLREMVESLGDAKRPLTLLGMVLNNHEANIHRWAKIRTTIEFLSAADAAGFKKLWRMELPMAVEGVERFEVPVRAEEDDDLATQCCLVAGMNTHWIVPPGSQRTRNPCSFPFDSTIHFAAVHLHNHGVYMRLTDLTTGEVVWQADVVNEPDRVQIAEIKTYSSAEGLRVHAAHDYEIEACYKNATDRDIDAMAMMYLYLAKSADGDSGRW